jgi:hypothetical protein
MSGRESETCFIVCIVVTKLHKLQLAGILAAHRILVLSPSMMSAKSGATSCFVSTTVLVGVIACLCFSVGEGLRLRPFPVSALAESEATNTQLNASASHENSLYKYGPLDVPTRVQKRGKRQVMDYGNAPSQNSRELIVQQVPLSSADKPAGIVSLSFESHFSGRAPPSNS